MFCHFIVTIDYFVDSWEVQTMIDTNLEQYWNDKHPKQRVIYNGRVSPTVCPTCGSRAITMPIPLDVRNFIKTQDAILQDIIDQNNLKADTNDETMLRIQRWVVANIKYTPDTDQQGTLEHWQFSFETLFSHRGDCEDGSILIANLAIVAGIPSWRVRVTAGMVLPAPTAPEGGHGYVAYLRESDDNFVAIDWCFFQDSDILTHNKPILKNRPEYKEIWFSFNDTFSWAHKEYEIVGRLRINQL